MYVGNEVNPVAFAMSGSVPIHYSVAGSGPPLVLYHGFGGSSEDWFDFGGLAPLAERYRLISLDARGHGCSGKPCDSSAYTLDQMVADVIAVLDALGIERTHYYGYSYGGLMGWALGVRAPERFESMVIGGAHPYSPGGEEMLGRFEAMMHYLRLGMPAYVRWREEHGVVWPEGFRARMLANQSDALAAFLQASQQHYPLGDLGRMTMPVLVVSGDDDELMAGSKARRAAAELPNGSYVEIPDVDHPALYLNGERVLPVLEAFLEEVSAPSRAGRRSSTASPAGAA
jgi:pimeloyl-ACP methyl ester carboxylesterase